MVDIVSLGGLGGLGSLIGAPDSDDVRSDEVVKELIINSFDEDTLLMIYNERISNGSYDKAMRSLGVVDRASPRSINIYVDTFADKDSVLKCIDAYNETVPEEDHITYRDITALLMESVTDMIDTTSYVLIAFVAVSLVVSSIMIGIITYISVLERTREIGILRALGASKRNISQVFNAETFLIGMLAGIFGVILSLLLLIPINAVIAKFTAEQGLEVSASLPVRSALFLIGLSTILTMIGGVIPSKKAAKRDPVAALRSE
jgi:putative ABC transport system permease protein